MLVKWTGAAVPVIFNKDRKIIQSVQSQLKILIQKFLKQKRNESSVSGSIAIKHSATPCDHSSRANFPNARERKRKSFWP